MVVHRHKTDYRHQQHTEQKSTRLIATGSSLLLFSYVCHEP